MRVNTDKETWEVRDPVGFELEQAKAKTRAAIIKALDEALEKGQPFSFMVHLDEFTMFVEAGMSNDIRKQFIGTMVDELNEEE